MGKTMILAFAAALAWGPVAQAQEVSAEISFTRVHLVNGNFIDGQLVWNGPAEVVLRLKYGEMTIRRDRIARDPVGKYRVELVKMRSLSEKAKTVEPPAPGPKGPKGPPEGGSGAEAGAEVTEASLELTQKIEQILQRVRQTPADQKYHVAKEIAKLGEEAALYLVSGMDRLEDDLLVHALPVVGEMKSDRLAPLLIKALDSRRPAVRTQAITLLSSLGDTGAVSALIPLLDDPAPTIRGPAIDALVRLNATQAFNPIAYLCSDLDSSVRSRAISGLFTLAQKNRMEHEIVPALTRALDRTQGEARSEVLMAFGRTGKPDGIRNVLPFLSDEDPKVRSAAAVAAGNMGGAEAGEAIVRQLGLEQEKWPWIYLVTAASKLKLASAMDVLIEGLSHTDNEMRLTALQGLRTISGQAIGIDRGAWKAWWAQNKPK
jgi:HEAT repeat protein